MGERPAIEAQDILVLSPVVRHADLALLAAELSPGEQQRASQCLFEPARAQFISAHVLKRRLIASCLGVAPDTLRFDYAASGKPALLGAHAGLHFSLSHTRTHVGVLLSAHGPVGFDLESERPLDTWQALIPEVFHPAERRALEPISRQTLYRYWTLKEAQCKALGSGLAIPLNTIAMRRSAPDLKRYSCDVQGLQWQLSAQLIAPRTHAAYCQRADGPAVWSAMLDLA